MKTFLIMLSVSLPVGGAGLVLAQGDPVDSLWEVAEQVPALVVLVFLVRAFFSREEKREEAVAEERQERDKQFTTTLMKVHEGIEASARVCHDVQRKATEAHVEGRKVTERLTHVVERLGDKIDRLQDGQRPQ